MDSLPLCLVPPLPWPPSNYCNQSSVERYSWEVQLGKYSWDVELRNTDEKSCQEIQLRKSYGKQLQAAGSVTTNPGYLQLQHHGCNHHHGAPPTQPRKSVSTKEESKKFIKKHTNSSNSITMVAITTVGTICTKSTPQWCTLSCKSIRYGRNYIVVYLLWQFLDLYTYSEVFV